MKNIFQAFLMLVMFTQMAWSQTMVEYNVEVSGLCGMCKDRIEKVALEKGGAEEASFNLESNILTVTIDHDKIAISEVRWELAQAGHDNGSFIAPDEVYNNLPLCCQHRVPENATHHEENATNVNPNDDGYIHQIDGYIFGDNKGKREALIGATVSLIGSLDTGTTTDENGYFQLDNSTANASGIEISYIGFETQQVEIDKNELYEITLLSGHELETVEIKYRRRTTEVSFVNAINVEKITREELCKAACCNLSESFETNPSVDVSFSDAVTGARQIQMLGLAGPNVQIGRELIPDVRGMASVYGLSMTPGPWIESIQLIKGVGSVVNGFESIAGQINVELKKPDAGDLLFLNGYVNGAGRLEINANSRKKISEGVSSALLIHGKMMSAAHDNNNDGFTDMPIEKDYVIANRWKFQSKGNIQGQLGIKLSNLTHEGGYHNHFSGEDPDHENHWRMNMNTDRKEVWGKIGYINQDKPENSLALQTSLVSHDQKSEFGFQKYDAKQLTFISNLIFQRIPNDNVVIRTGLSYQLDEIDELVAKAGFFERREYVPGAYFEYTYKKENKFSIIPGIRVDHHSNYGWIVSPRLHGKYNFSEKSIVRGVIGKGWRTANIFAENLGIFSSSRQVLLNGDNASDNPYGLNPEIAWNMGLSYTQAFQIKSRELIIGMDFYRTQFENQIVLDYELAREVSIYNLDGESFSNSYQIKLEYEAFENFDLRLAYRLFDVQSDYANDGRLQKPLISKHRAFVNAAYKTKSDWHFDATLSWNGEKRLPNTENNPEQYRLEANSPSYFLLNAQIMKRWGKKWDVYLGGENILNYKQPNAFIGADDPFGQYFDGSIVWAPLFGTNIYLGFRMTITEEK